MFPVLNDTKWKELQEAMYGLKELSPKWRTKHTKNGYISDWDGEWFYHFSDGKFKDIEWVEIKVENEKQKLLVLTELRNIHVPGIETVNGFKVFGFVQEGVPIEYL